MRRASASVRRKPETRTPAIVLPDKPRALETIRTFSPIILTWKNLLAFPRLFDTRHSYVPPVLSDILGNLLIESLLDGVSDGTVSFPCNSKNIGLNVEEIPFRWIGLRICILLYFEVLSNV
jgi:hypothetical protein